MSASSVRLEGKNITDRVLSRDPAERVHEPLTLHDMVPGLSEMGIDEPTEICQSAS